MIDAPLPCLADGLPPDVHVGRNFTAKDIHALVNKHTKLLGSGAFGKVFAAELTSVGRVAIKVATAQGAAALRNEARVLQHAVHPCIVAAVGSCWSGGVEAIVYDYIPRGSLFDRLEIQVTPEEVAAANACDMMPVHSSHNPPGLCDNSACTAASSCDRTSQQKRGQKSLVNKYLTWRQRIKVSYQLASALAFLHSHDPPILHRDVKPGNVLLDSSNNALLADVGIAKLMDTSNAIGSPKHSSGAAGHAAHSSHGGGMGGYAHHPSRLVNTIGQAHGHDNSRGHFRSYGQGLSDSCGQTHGQTHNQIHGRHDGHQGLSHNSHPAAPASPRLLAAVGCLSPRAGDGVLQQRGWAGTHDYLDPLYEQLGQLCDRSDVYALGVIMCQLILDKSDPREARRVLQHNVKSKKIHLPDQLQDWSPQLALAYGELAVHCAAQDRSVRPSATEAAAALQLLLVEAGLAGFSVLVPGNYECASHMVSDKEATAQQAVACTDMTTKQASAAADKVLVSKQVPVQVPAVAAKHGAGSMPVVKGGNMARPKAAWQGSDLPGQLSQLKLADTSAIGSPINSPVNSPVKDVTHMWANSHHINIHTRAPGSPTVFTGKQSSSAAAMQQRSAGHQATALPQQRVPQQQNGVERA